MSQSAFNFVEDTTEHTLFVDGEWVGKTVAQSPAEAIGRLREALYGAYDRIEWRPAVDDPPEEWESLEVTPF